MSFKHKPLFVAITGGIACGKSTAAEFFRKKNYPVYSADTIAHKILDSPFAKKKLFTHFTNISDDNGNIDRKKLGKIVFSDKDKLLILNRIIHPMVENEINKIKSTEKSEIVFFEIPLLFEADKQREYDVIINISCKKNIQLKRLIQRNNLSENEAIQRINSQLPISIKKKYSHFNIENNGSMEDFLHKLNEILKKIKENLL